jgi:hypothetical protein
MTLENLSPLISYMGIDKLSARQPLIRNNKGLTIVEKKILRKKTHTGSCIKLFFGKLDIIRRNFKTNFKTIRHLCIRKQSNLSPLSFSEELKNLTLQLTINSREFSVGRHIKLFV